MRRYEVERKQLEVEANMQDQLARIEAEKKKFATAVTKSLMTEKELREEAEEKKREKKLEMEMYLNRKKIKTEWKRLQDLMLKTLNQKIRLWSDNGTEEGRQDLYEMLEASDAALKAQYFEATRGEGIEAGAQRAAEKAIASLGKYADQEAKLMAARQAADLFIKQEAELRRQIELLDKAMRLLGD